MLVIDEKREISMDKNRNNLTVKIKKTGLMLLLLTGILILLLLTSCNGVVPEPPTPPGPIDDVADSYKVTAIAPYYEVEEAKHYCLISKGVIVTNYEENYGVENPLTVLTQQELADAIFGEAGADPGDLVDYINSRNDLNIQAEYKPLTFLQIQKMLEDDIVPIVLIDVPKTAIMPVGYNKKTNEITIYSTLDGNEHTMYEFKYLDPDYNKSVIIINNSELSTINVKKDRKRI